MYVRLCKPTFGTRTALAGATLYNYGRIHQKTGMLLVQLRPKLKLVLLYFGHFVTNDWLRNVSLTLNERIDDKCCAEHCGSGRKIRFDLTL